MSIFGRLLTTVLVLVLVSSGWAEVRTVIPNHLRQHWPMDPTYVVLPPDQAEGLTVAEIGDHRRPVQIEHAVVDGRPIARAWFMATIDERERYEDDRGRTVTGIVADVPVRLADGEIEPGIRLQETDQFFIIDNGIYQFRVRQSQTFDTPRPLSEVPHWSGGMRLGGEGAWDGRAWFEGDSLVRGVRVEVVKQGPVFIDIAVVYDFESEADGVTAALPLEMGKQTYRWQPNTPPREMVTKLDRAYELRLRFLMSHPLIEINERFHLPRSSGAADSGPHRYLMAWGRPVESPHVAGFDASAFMPVDTITWVRWFLYDAFGGNVDQNWVPAVPRPDQRGRPFAQLRPRWHQGGGGAQDFVMTTGGPRVPTIDQVIDGRNGIEQRLRRADEATRAKVAPLLAEARDESKTLRARYKSLAEAGGHLEMTVRVPPESYSPDNPAVALIATFASKWVGPYAATIATHARDGNRALASFPLADGQGSGLYYGQRSYVIGVGTRSNFNSLNDVVRRFTDWTLVAVHNKYITRWERNPEKAGPNAIITRKRLEELRTAYREQSGIEWDLMAQDMADMRALARRAEELRPRVAAAQEASRDQSAGEEDRNKAAALLRELSASLREVENQWDSTDMQLLRMIATGESPQVRIPDAGLWLARRYQDDFLNPTQRTTRQLKDFATADLFSNGRLIGGPMHAPHGYIATDLDAWPGWHHGWLPGNPNFHTDKYMAAIFVGAAMRDHPHSDEWLSFGLSNFKEDIERTLLPPDGVGYECPGYAGYALGIQLGLARILENVMSQEIVATNPLFKATGIWHRKLLTPFDYRLGFRHAAPIGDTHRWTSGLNHGFGKLASFYTESDPEFASEMQGTWKMLLREGGISVSSRLQSFLIEGDPSIEPMDPAKMDWSSRAFHGFGAIMRHRFGEGESFLSIKAGPMRGHYHNDELAFHYYANGHPVSMDYNTGYAPRGDHAALHNSMTFGVEGEVLHNRRNEMVPAMEQIYSTAWAGAFASSPVADVFVAERRGNSLTMTPIRPENAEFARRYPSRQVDRIVHRRFIAMMKQPEGSPFSDYLVVREETISNEPQAVNVHLLARSTRVDGNLILGDGQWGMDMAVYVAEAQQLEVDDSRHWWHMDPGRFSPGREYEYRPGETTEQWAERMAALKQERRAEQIPLPDADTSGRSADEAERARWRRLLQETDGRALMPPPNWQGTWLQGEYQRWVRLNTAPGTPVLWVLYPYEKGGEVPQFERLADGTGVRVSLNGQWQEIYMATDPAEDIPGQVVVRQADGQTVLLERGVVPALGEIRHEPLGPLEP